MNFLCIRIYEKPHLISDFRKKISLAGAQTHKNDYFRATHYLGCISHKTNNLYKVKQYENRAILMPHYYTFLLKKQEKNPGCHCISFTKKICLSIKKMKIFLICQGLNESNFLKLQA